MPSTPRSVAAPLRRALVDGIKQLMKSDDRFNGVARRQDLVEVTRGFGFGSSATEQLYLGRYRVETPPAALRAARGTRNETGDLDLVVRIRKVGSSADEAEDRLLEIWTACESWLAERRSNELQVPGLQTLTVRRWAADYRGIDSGHGGVLVATLRWTARLT